MSTNKYILPPKEAVMPDWSIALWALDETEGLWGVEKLTDLSDIDYTPLKNPKLGYIYLLWYQPNKDKKFTFFPIKDPRYKNVIKD